MSCRQKRPSLPKKYRMMIFNSNCYYKTMTAEINRVPGDAKRIKPEQIRPYRQFRELSRVKLTEKEGVGKEK